MEDRVSLPFRNSLNFLFFISIAKMYLLQKAHPIIDDTARPRLLGSGEGAEKRNPLREPCELKICDLDDVVYKVWVFYVFQLPHSYLPISAC